jgi:hypothetical protein
MAIADIRKEKVVLYKQLAPGFSIRRYWLYLRK